jgi:hypothetical protein
MKKSKEKSHTQHHGAHSGSRLGISDYNDGGEFSHYGGNDDIRKHTRESDREVISDEIGIVAYGNDNESDEEDYGKSHSGL